MSHADLENTDCGLDLCQLGTSAEVLCNSSVFLNVSLHACYSYGTVLVQKLFSASVAVSCCGWAWCCLCTDDNSALLGEGLQASSESYSGDFLKTNPP